MLTRENHSAQDNNLLHELARLMSGDFSNRQQSDADPKNYAHIRIFFFFLPWDFFSGICFFLLTIPTDCIERRHNCSMVFWKEGEMFRGSVEPGNKCLIHRKGVNTYLVSSVELTETTWISWDRGMDLESHEQIWGSAAGPLKFTKKESFAHELPWIGEDKS